MIDLISHGFSLRKKILIAIEYYPQIIRSSSAGPLPYKQGISASSAESASIDKKNHKNINYDNQGEFKLCHAAEIAEVADSQLTTSFSIEDKVRKDCGLVACNDCMHFTPDTIGDGVGIGNCNLRIKWTSEVNGKMPLYRYATRNCASFNESTN